MTVTGSKALVRAIVTGHAQKPLVGAALGLVSAAAPVCLSAFSAVFSPVFSPVFPLAGLPA